MLSVKQGGIKYHFLSLWYDSTWDWTPVFQDIDEHSNHYANGPIYIYYTHTHTHNEFLSSLAMNKEFFLKYIKLQKNLKPILI